MPRPPKVRQLGSPYLLLVTTYKERPARPPRRSAAMRADRFAQFTAADETGTGAVPDMAEVLRAYRARNRR